MVAAAGCSWPRVAPAPSPSYVFPGAVVLFCNDSARVTSLRITLDVIGFRPRLVLPLCGFGPIPDIGGLVTTLSLSAPFWASVLGAGGYLSFEG